MMQTTYNIDKEKVKAYRDRLMTIDDPYAIFYQLDLTMDYVMRDVQSNGKNEFYETLHNNLYPIKMLYDILPDLMEPYCYAQALSRVHNHYESERRQFIEDNELEGSFKKYLKQRGITEYEYYTEFVTRCLMQEYTIMAQMIDKRPKFVSSRIDTIKHMRDFNSVHLPAVEIVTSNNVYALI